MTCHADHANRWVDVVLGRTNKALLSPGRSNVFGSGDYIYSYGRHFEMGRVQRDRKGNPIGFLLNGDRVSVTTSQHQSIVRDAVQRSGLPWVIIPYSALASAGVDRDTVQVVEALPDRWEETNHVSYEQPEGSRWVDIGRYEYVDKPADHLAEIIARHNQHERWSWEGRLRRHTERPDVFEAPPPEPRTFTVDDLHYHERKRQVQVGSDFHLQLGYRDVDVTALPDGRVEYRWTTTKHWLGESLVRAKVSTQRRCGKCSGTGTQYPNAPVRPWDLPSCEHCVQGFKRVKRTAYFLSGFDHNERQPVYFFCELPRGPKPTTVAEAYEALKPESVKLAEQMGRSVSRQGDIFAIELPGLSKRELRSQGARFEKRGNLLRTNHEATEVAYLRDGTTLVRGTLWHNPAGRPPDHRRVTVGKAWHLAVKNTVPISK